MKRGLMLILVLFGMGLTALAQTAFDTRYNKAYEYYKKGEYRNALIQLDAASKGPRTQEQQIKADKLINQCNNAIAAANTLKVTPAELTIPFSGGRDSVVVKAGSKWKVGSMPKWLSHVQLGTTLVFSVSPNAERAERSGYVEIVMGRYKEYVKVVQEARPEAVRKVHVRTKPEKAKIVVDNEQSALTNYSFDLREGHHSIVITKNGYEPVATSVTIPDEITDEPINLEIPLVPMFGTISLNVKTGTGEGFTETPVAEIGNKPVDLYPVKLYSFDEEADIRYYELYEGNIIPLYPAEYQVKVKAEGYREQTCPIIVSRGSHEDLEFVLNNRVGSFSVDNFGLAEGARILLDGKDVGEVPAKQIPARVGRHKLHFVKEGYITPQESYIVDISEGRDVIVTVSMDRYAAYRFVTNPEGAVLSVDGKVMGGTPVEVVLREGDHKVEMAFEGYYPYKAVVTPELDGAVHEVSVDLSKSYPVRFITDRDSSWVTVSQNGELFAENVKTTSPVALPLSDKPYKFTLYDGRGKLAYKGRFKMDKPREKVQVLSYSQNHNQSIGVQYYVMPPKCGPVVYQFTNGGSDINLNIAKVGDAYLAKFKIFPGLSTSLIKASLFAPNGVKGISEYADILGKERFIPAFSVLFVNEEFRVGGYLFDNVEANALATYTWYPKLTSFVPLTHLSGHEVFVGLELSTRIPVINANTRVGYQTYFAGSVNFYDKSRQGSGAVEKGFNCQPFNYGGLVVSLGFNLGGHDSKGNNTIRVF